MADLVICTQCGWLARPEGQWVPHDGPCGEECEENLTGCHCATPAPFPVPGEGK